MWHRSSVDRLAGAPLDLLVIGGGITGAGIARDAAMRGLRTGLVERGDLASGTSSKSSRLIHGGLRYLEQGNLRLVFEALRERRILLGIAPHLIRPLPFLFPVHRGDRRPLWQVWAGIWAYDLLAAFRNVGWHRLLGKRGLLGQEPRIREKGLLGGIRYFDAQCDDARLTIATARGAMRHGAMVGNYLEAVDLLRSEGRVSGARIRDLLTGAEGAVQARVVVNATGPWSDALRQLEDPGTPPLLRLTRGAHLMVRRERLGHQAAITLTSPIDGRVMFVIPWGEFSYIGTTDVDVARTTSPGTVRATPEDVVYLLRSANAAFPQAHLAPSDVLTTWAALRPLVGEDGTRSASDVSREHRILTGAGGMLTIVGGKLTTYRVMAREVVDLAVDQLCRHDGRPRPPVANTAAEPLPGGEARDPAGLGQPGLDLGLPPETVDHLVRLYGAECAAVFNLIRERRELGRPLLSGYPAIEAEVVHVTRRELARRVADVLVRRLHPYHETPDHAVAAAGRTAELMAGELGWDRAQTAAEAARYREFVAREAVAAAE